MDITVNRSDILKALSMCASVVDKKATAVPILQDVLIVADAESVRLHATDLTVTVGLTCPARVRTSGSLMISHQTLTEFLRNLPDESVILTHAGGKYPLKIECGTTKFTVPVAHDAADYPTLPELGDAPPSFAVEDIATVAAAYTTTGYAIGDGVVAQGRTTFQKGVLMLVLDGKAEFCATNGLRMAVVSFRTNEGSVSDITPIRAARALAKFEGAAKFYVGTDHTHVVFADGTLAYRRIDGSFPDYRPHVPPRSESAITLDRKRFTDAVRRAMMLTPKDRGVEIMAAMNRLTVRPMHAERGEGSDTMPYEGESGVKFGASGDYLLQALDAMTADSISLSCDREIVMRPVVDDLDAPDEIHMLGTRSN